MKVKVNKKCILDFMLQAAQKIFKALQDNIADFIRQAQQVSSTQ